MSCLPAPLAGSVTLARRFHIGDTPMDLQAAEGAGAQGVGVTTGVFSREELKAVSPGARVGHTLSSLWSQFGVIYQPRSWHPHHPGAGHLPATMHTDRIFALVMAVYPGPHPRFGSILSSSELAEAHVVAPRLGAWSSPCFAAVHQVVHGATAGSSRRDNA